MDPLIIIGAIVTVLIILIIGTIGFIMFKGSGANANANSNSNSSSLINSLRNTVSQPNSSSGSTTNPTTSKLKNDGTYTYLGKRAIIGHNISCTRFPEAASVICPGLCSADPNCKAYEIGYSDDKKDMCCLNDTADGTDGSSNYMLYAKN